MILAARSSATATIATREGRWRRSTVIALSIVVFIGIGVECQVKQRSGEELSLRIGSQTATGTSAKGIVKQEIECENLGQLESLDTGDAEFLKMRLNSDRR